MRRPIGVSGIGIVSPFGTTRESFVDNLIQGRSALLPVEGFDTSQCSSTLAAQVTTFQPTDWLPPMRLRRLERAGMFAVAVARLAFDDAGRLPTPNGDPEAGVVLGTWTAGGQSSESYLDAFFTGGPQMAPALLFESTVGNAPASLVALEHRLRGPNATLSHGEASGLVAMASAVQMLRLGRAARVLTGGVEMVYETFYRICDRFRIMSPATACSRATAPFDAERTGFVLGEGGVGFWLEPAQADAPPPVGQYGWILGIAESGAAVGINHWPSSPEPLVRTMMDAIADAGIRPADVGVVYASANGTRDLDRVEAAALDRVFGGTQTVVTSIKGALGESGLSGATSCAAAFLCGRHALVPPIAGLTQADPEAARLNLAREATGAPSPIALVNAFASGGGLCSVVVRVRS